MSTIYITFFVVAHIIIIISSVNYSNNYLIGSSKMNWTEAKSFCEGLGTNLASVHSLSQFTETKELCSSFGNQSGCMIGLNDINNEGEWNWDDGTITDYGFNNNDSSNPTNSVFPWKGNEPNDQNGIEDCVELALYANYRWNDIPCNWSRLVICNVPSIDPTNLTTYLPTSAPVTLSPIISTPITPNPTTTPTEAPTYNITEVQVARNTCFTAIKYETDYMFSPPFDGVIFGTRLVHTSGGVKTCPACPYTNWGDFRNGIYVNLLNEDLGQTIYPTATVNNISGISTTAENVLDCECEYRLYSISGYDHDSAEYIMMDPDNPINVSIEESYSLQFSEGCCSFSTGDNDGNSCADVYFYYIQIITTAPTPYPTMHPVVDSTNISTTSPTSDLPTNPTTESKYQDNSHSYELEYKIIFDCSNVDIQNYYIENMNESHQLTALERCRNHLGNPIQAKDTFENMNKHFYDILQDIADETDIIDGILHSPLISLRNGEDFINCDDGFDALEIIINLALLSQSFDSTTIFTKLFDNPDGIFVQGAERKLTLSFGTATCMEFISSINESSENSLGAWGAVIVMAILSCCVTVIAAVLCNKYRQKKRKLSYTTYINNPLVIAIAIGKYDDKNNKSEIDGIVQNLVSIDNDIKNVVKLFGLSLNYRIIPNYDINKPIKTRWTKDEIFELLQNQANDLNKSVQNNEHDALIVVISSHGIQDHIITSDYGKINKDTIHRIFSVDYPLLRDIPRIFMYDCCDGDNDMIRDQSRMYGDHDTLHRQISKGEYVQVKDHIVAGAYGADKEVWYKGEANPDYKLVIINSSNPGFVSQMGAISGSFMITKFAQKMQKNLKKPRDRLFLNEIFHQIQKELHDEEGKQLIEAKYNNKLEYIKFKKNESKDKHKELLELTEIENEQTELTEIKGKDMELRKCGECTKQTCNDMGRIDENDGNWYCNQCWDVFY